MTCKAMPPGGLGHSHGKKAGFRPIGPASAGLLRLLGSSERIQDLRKNPNTFLIYPIFYLLRVLHNYSKFEATLWAYSAGAAREAEDFAELSSDNAGVFGPWLLWVNLEIYSAS